MIKRIDQWHANRYGMPHRQDNENHGGEHKRIGFSPRGSRRGGWYRPPSGHLFCSLSIAGSLLHGHPCFCTDLRCGSSGRASAENSILPPPRRPPKQELSGRHWRFEQLYYSKIPMSCKEKEEKSLPTLSLNPMPCHAEICGSACSASSCARWVW